jgi:hypothetical protein
MIIAACEAIGSMPLQVLSLRATSLNDSLAIAALQPQLLELDIGENEQITSMFVVLLLKKLDVC